jgi:hypothetical protein
MSRRELFTWLTDVPHLCTLLFFFAAFWAATGSAIRKRKLTPTWIWG